MSSIEERLTRDIAAVTARVVVTDADLRDARDTLERRIESRRQRDRRRVASVAAAAAAAAVVVGIAGWQWLGSGDASPAPAEPVPSPTPSPAPSDSSASDEAFLAGDAPTTELLRGVWRLDNPGRPLMVRFGADGEIRFDNSGQLFGSAAVIGSYDIAGDQITVHVDDGLAGCGGQTFAMRAAVPEPGQLRFLHTQPGTGNCSPEVNEQWSLEQVLPTNADLADFAVPEGGAWDPPKSANVMQGAWFAEGGGHLLELTPEGSYAVADESGEVVDRGLWYLGSGRASLDLLSGADSPTCGEGDRLVLADLGLSFVYSDTPGLRATVQRNDCDGAWGKRTWLRLSHP